MRRFSLLLFALAFVSQLTAQSGSAPRQLSFHVSPTPAWTDTGLNLQAGDAVMISAASSGSPQNGCDPAGTGASVASLPVPDARSGALIARLEVDAPAMLIGAQREINFDKTAHLFLGLNGPGAPACQAGIDVKVQVSTKDSAQGNTADQKNRGDQLKSQLANAAQVFMSGQFGTNNSAPSGENATNSAGGGTASVPALHVSTTPLEADLRKSLDGLPRRVNDQFNNLGDMVNFVIIGSEKDVQDALAASEWHVADTSNTKAVISAVMQTYDNKDYLAMPMSTLFLFGRKQDFGYEMADPIAMVASRHHFRIWKAPFTWKGQQVWVGAGTHDIGFAKDKRNNSVTHKIDPSVDGERENIGASLQKSNKAKTFSYYLPPNPVQEAKNATGDGYHSDGRLLVVVLK
jgi:LssY C-terminus